jgi:hypothetical protein
MNEYLKNLERIEFIVTMACTGRCIHCSEGSHERCGGHIDGAAAAKAVAEVCGKYCIRSLMTFGGEPLLYPETVCMIHRAARAAGIPQRDIITNGFFSRNRNRIRETAEMLGESGVNRILLSVDAFHQETIPLEPVKFFADCAVAAGIRTELSPAWLVSRDDDNPYNRITRELIAEFAGSGTALAEGNVIFPSGNALKYLGEYFVDSREYLNPYEDDPRDIRSLCFGPDGSVLNGNIGTSSVLGIMEAYTP